MRAAISLAVVICLAMQQPSGGAATAAAPQRQRPSDSEADGGGGGVGTQAFYILFANQIESPDWPGADPLYMMSDPLEVGNSIMPRFEIKFAHHTACACTSRSLLILSKPCTTIDNARAVGSGSAA